jgi:Sec-independent protein translocase protein TatA
MPCGRLGPLEIILILGAALFFLGPKRLAQAVRNVFQGLTAMKEAVKEESVPKKGNGTEKK